MNKKLLLILSFFAFSTIAGKAQELHVVDDNLDKLVLACSIEGPAMVSLDLKHQLGLNQEQFSKVEKIVAEKFEQLKAAESKFVFEPDLLQHEKSEINYKTEKALNAILTAKQMHAYLELAGRLDSKFLTDKSEQE
ncbi:hypothetical protein [Pontibacter sp. SGAir0037]|uniref:hypothetical protein n=1 Tax=Pontibacter sp. SGAir0037 TaxID=2571030 RepID=UPI0010CD52E9|nr:hypothetical protein [Pontibacter sp. SGAir0037]QCR21669.1 hypothetical protein C1N53_04460 [Pontibacter sp. SGAir0037]